MTGRVADFGVDLRSKSALDRTGHPVESKPTPISLPDEAKGSLELLENLQEGVWIADDSGRIVFANGALARLVGCSGPEELTGRQWHDLLSEGSADRLERLRGRSDTAPVASILTSENRRVPVTIALSRRTFGKDIWHIGSALPAAAPLSEQGPVEAAGTADRTHADLVAMVSHDLRTPLASVKEALSLLDEISAGLLDDRQRRYLTIAREGTGQLDRMVDNLVEASRMASGKASLRLEAIDLPELLATVVSGLLPATSKRDLIVVRNVPPQLPPVMADRDGLRRVFNNILDNAIKHSPPGGTISVDMSVVAADAALLLERGIPAGIGCVQITVSDVGPGIPAESLDRIFGKFERVDPDRPGIGLGLAIVRSIVEMHHGRVWAESSLGDGARLHFVLPIKENA